MLGGWPAQGPGARVRLQRRGTGGSGARRTPAARLRAPGNTTALASDSGSRGPCGTEQGRVSLTTWLSRVLFTATVSPPRTSPEGSAAGPATPGDRSRPRAAVSSAVKAPEEGDGRTVGRNHKFINS